jgi:sulfide dehydrogenase [flavocytochrome c] flavoprotein chain
VDNTEFSRRRFGQAIGAGAALTVLGACATQPQQAAPARRLGRVLVVGGGYGGATAAKYLKYWGGNSIDVVLIERNPQFVSCPISNLVIGGSRRLEDITIGYQGLRERGVLVLNDEVTAIDPAKKRIVLKKIADQSYDRLIVAPGIDFMFGDVQGLDADAQKTVLHAWKAGEQTVGLRRQLEEMRDGGVFVITIPKSPYRCPPGPYERVCQVAHYLKTAKPRSKIVVLDGNPDIQSKKGLFEAAWKGRYAGMIDYRPNHDVTEVDARNRVAITELGERIRADVLNLIPPQRAGDLARQAGLVNVNNRWCGVDWMTMESTAVPGVHVLGDATLSAPGMPKSGHIANQHGKTVAAALLEILDGRPPQPPVMANTCYSFVDDREAMHVASVHQWVPDRKSIEPVAGAGGVSGGPSETEGQLAHAWARNIWRDMLS